MLKLPAFSKYAPIPYPLRKLTVITILRHVSVAGWIASCIGLIIAIAVIIAAHCRIVSPAFAGFLAAAVIFFWYRLIYREAKYETNGEIIDMGGSDAYEQD